MNNILKERMQSIDNEIKQYINDITKMKKIKLTERNRRIIRTKEWLIVYLETVTRQEWITFLNSLE
jgi:hypothetical protein